MDPGIKIPVTGYGGHERLVEMFAKQYVAMGHRVEVLHTAESSIAGCTMHNLGKEGFPPNKWDARKAIFTAWRFLNKNKSSFDLIHNFGRLIYLLPVWNSSVKKIMTYGREISGKNINLLLRLPHKNIVFTGCSNNLISRSGAKGNWQTVYNAIPFSNYNVTEKIDVDSPLIFLGRIEKIKGCHTAISVAKATNSKLVIAGNVSPLAEEKSYFENEIRPFIDGNQIQYIGTVNDEQKNKWLGKAKALLMPIEWNEPFGIVMIEAMACGTPVIAFNKGSVNEVVDEGITGFKVNTAEEMINAVKDKAENINRKTCADKAKERFDVNVIAQRYLNEI
jgi:glycosyltransferase involved in cell wall biosynthesis